MLALNKAVSLVSSHGAAETVIDGVGSGASKTVLIITDGGAFGKPGKGFSVTRSGGGNHDALVIDANNVSVRGNQIIAILTETPGNGIDMVDSPGSVVVERSQVIGWTSGILMRGANKTVRKNVASNNTFGIVMSAGSTASGNVVTGNSRGICLRSGASTVSGNAVIANVFGLANNCSPFFSGTAFTGTISNNNIIDNFCGLQNDGLIGLAADHNYWGAATGPGADPADDVCNVSGGTTTVTPFAATPFRVKPSIKP